MRALRVIVVEDEPLARAGLSLRLQWIPDIEIVAQCESTAEAIEAIATANPEVIFLDIEMPEADGFELLRRIRRDLLPVVVITTAHRDRALDAFRSGVADYLVKPFDDASLRTSVTRARTLVEAARSAAAGQSGRQERLKVQRRGRTLYFNPSEIEWVEAARDCVRLHIGGESYPVRATMRAMDAQLRGGQFVRVHRGAIVRVALIRGLEPYSRGEHLVVLRDGTKLPMSRRYRARVEQALNAAVG